MKTRTAVVYEPPSKYEVIEVDLDEPREDEVTVRTVAAGLCHSDDHFATGDVPAASYPWAGGHEGAGVVEIVGPNTRGIEVGDYVVYAFLPVCGRCHFCATGHQALCDLGAMTQIGSRFDDPTSFRMHYQGTPVGQMSGVGTFSELSTVDIRSVIKIPKDIPLDVAALVGCGVPTGWGSAVNSAKAGPGDVIIVMGVGGIGINAVQGAAQAGAAQVVAVDPVPFKRENALAYGATSAFASIEEAAEYVLTQTNGQGADATIVTIGVTTGLHIAQAYETIRKGGTVVLTGVGNFLSTDGIPINSGPLTFYQKRLQGSLFGECNPTTDIPRLLRMNQEGSLRLGEEITRRYRLDEVAQGYEDMHAGVNIRGVIDFS